MQQYCAVCTRESNLLYIHRSYFAQALRQLPENPLHHKFAASVMAAYRAATRLIASLRSLYQIHAHPTGHVWYFWSGIFSSCILLGALVVESPKCTLAGDAFRELQQAVPFFIEGSRVCRSQGSVPILEKLLQRAQASFQSGIESQHPEADVDELHVLGGRKSVIKPPSNAGSPALTPGTPSSAPHEEYLGHAPNTFVNRYNYDNQSVPHSAYPSEDTYAAKSPGSQTGFLRPYVSPPGSVAGPDPGLQHYHRPQQMAPSSSVASDHHQWQASYPSSVPHAQSHPQHQQTPHTGTSSLMYGHPMDVNSPQAYHPVIQRYGSGAPHERTQEEIWRDFMMGYQPS
ncbi:hypothetical protein FA15DRAFT_341874 [Coprinopsis marcescibilis]|uniref:Transcription factor domain-containing protein n=1 Tax=Coprinopsis marcescibilis TaxID=230819 RepID=A0A5C3KYC0_COPMA|nr:hypothetical protein FA15DRAFT_341874 [Coprinopsis marcescibilis]